MNLYVDKTLVQTLSSDGGFGAGRNSRSFYLRLLLRLKWIGKETPIKAEVIAKESDEIPENNILEAIIIASQSELPVITDLVGEKTEKAHGFTAYPDSPTKKNIQPKARLLYLCPRNTTNVSK